MHQYRDSISILRSSIKRLFPCRLQDTRIRFQFYEVRLKDKGKQWKDKACKFQFYEVRLKVGDIVENNMTDLYFNSTKFD